MKKNTEQQMHNEWVSSVLPVQLTMYQTPRGRPWVKCTWKHQKRPLWYFWVFRDGEKTFKWPHQWKSKVPEHGSILEGWLRFEGGDPEIKLGSLNAEKWKKLRGHPETTWLMNRMFAQERIERAAREGK